MSDPVGTDAIRIGFRLLTDDDLPLLHRWLNDPDVVRWWEGDDVTWTGVLGRYSTAATADDSVEHHLVLVDDRPVGWIQCWFLRDEPDMAEWVELGFDPLGTAGIDYLIGESVDRGSGLGAAMIAEFVDRVVFGAHPGIDAVGSDPDRANERSWRALAAAGFRPVADRPEGARTYRVMRRDRPTGVAT